MNQKEYNIPEKQQVDDSISVNWHFQDVKERAAQRKISLTCDQAREVLASVKLRHDPEIGINWDVIDVHIDMLVDPM